MHVTLPNGSHISIKYSGSFLVHDKLTLHDVLFVPTFHYNLFSVSKWTAHTGGTVTFFPDHCIFQVQNQKDIIALGNLQSGLYHLNMFSTLPPAVSTSVSSFASSSNVVSKS